MSADVKLLNGGGTTHTGSWKFLVACAATIETGHCTQFSPDGFAAWLGERKKRDTWLWYAVKLGELVLRHDGRWWLPPREQTLEERVAYAHPNAVDALAALRRAVAPREPLCAALIERFHRGV